MILFFLSWISLAQYSPELYTEQTRHCPFRRLLPATTPAWNELLQNSLQGIKKQYPLSSVWMQDEGFLQQLGQALYKNEANCLEKNLTYWNPREPFPSLGLPHAIWYPKAIQDKKYQEQFPELIRFIRTHLKREDKVNLTWPTRLQEDPLPPAPWGDAKTFSSIQKISERIAEAQSATQLLTVREKNPELYQQAYELFTIRHFLANPVVLKLQAQFVMDKTFLTLHRILLTVEKTSPKETPRFYNYLQTLLSTQEGVLALIDYLNFKGDGLKPSERTDATRFYWGLKTVLDMASHSDVTSALCTVDVKNSDCALHKFADATLCSLQRVAYEAGPMNSETQTQRYLWLNGGWKTRIDSNYRPNTFQSPRCVKGPSISSGG